MGPFLWACWVGLLIIAGWSACVFGLFVLFNLSASSDAGSTHAPGDTPQLYDASWYYYKVEDNTYRVVILRDGTHTLIQEPVIEDLP